MTFVLLIAVIILIILLIKSKTQSKKIIVDLKNITNSLTFKVNDFEQEQENLNHRIEYLEDNNNSLKKYQGIVDTEQKAKDILLKANLEAKEILDNAKKEIENVVLEANSIKSKANTDASILQQKAITLLNNATEEAKLVIEQAEIKAQEIAGDAYKALQNSKELEKTAKAMKNIIEGYGDLYLIQTYSLLDDLAEDFGHTEAGEKLKLAREKTCLMIKNGTSAKCDYVEANRKEIAINFILDAFNGKVDSILSKVKKDNYGTLEQKIMDSY